MLARGLFLFIFHLIIIESQTFGSQDFWLTAFAHLCNNLEADLNSQDKAQWNENLKWKFVGCLQIFFKYFFAEISLDV